MVACGASCRAKPMLRCSIANSICDIYRIEPACCSNNFRMVYPSEYDAPAYFDLVQIQPYNGAVTESSGCIIRPTGALPSFSNQREAVTPSSL
jgi:hypothetical protein